MPDDLPDVGFQAVIDNIDKFLKDAKSIEDAYARLETREAAIGKASEANAAAMDTISAALSRAGTTAQATAAQIQQAADSFEGFIPEDVSARIEAVYEAFGKISPEAEASVREIGAAFIDSAENAEAFASQFEAQMESAAFAIGPLANKYADFIQSVADTSALQHVERVYKVLEQGSPELVADLRQQQEAWLAAGKSAEEWAAEVESSFGKTVREIEQGANQASGALENMASILGFGVVQQFAGTASRVGGQLIGLAKDATETAARIEELGLVLGNLAQQNNISEQALNDQVEAIRAQGIQADVAYNLVSQFVRANLDLSKASDLARLAQDAAVISMEDSSQALAGLVHGILTLQPEVLRYRGIIIDLQGEYKKWADENNKSVMSLTSVEKQAIALEAALAQGATIAGTYESAMESASKQLRSMPRYINDLKAEMGDSLLPVYSDVIFATKDVIKEVSALPEPMKAAIASSGALAGGLLKGTSAAIGFGAQIGQLIPALTALKASAAGSALAFLGPLGLVAGLVAVVGVGVYSAVKANEEAHRAESAAVLNAAETYDDYVKKAERAELGSYTLSEGLFEIAKGANAAKDGVDALALTKSWRELELFFGIGGTGIDWLDDFAAKLPAVGVNVDTLANQMTYFVKEWDAAKLAVLEDEEALRSLGTGLKLTGDDLEEFIVVMQEIVRAEEIHRASIQASIGREEEYWKRIIDNTNATREWAGTMSEAEEAAYKTYGSLGPLVTSLDEMARAALRADPAVAGLTEQLVKLLEKGGEGAALQYTFAQLADIANKAEADITKAGDEARADREKAEEKYLSDVADLESDYGKRRADIMDDLADVNADLLDEMARANADYQADRLALEQEGIAALEQEEADHARAQAELHDELLNDLAEADRKANEKRADYARDMARDLEDIERASQSKIEELTASHEKKLLGLARDRAEREAEMAEQNAERLLAIQDRFARERAGIEAKYAPDAGPDFDEQRKALQEQLAEIRAIQSAGMTGIDYTQDINDILAQLDALKTEELAALEQAQAEQLASLEQALADEQAVRDAAYEKAVEAENARYASDLEKEQAAFEERKAERQRQYDRQLEDLNISLAREKDARQRAYAERVAELQASHAEQMAEIQRANAEQLAALDQQNADEKERLAIAAQDRRDAIAERLADEKTGYDERLAQLGTAYDAEKKTIDEKLDEQGISIREKADEQTETMVKAWEAIDPGIAAALDATIANTIRPRMDAIIGEIQRLKNEIANLGMVGQSPAPWWLDMGKSWSMGLERGGNLGAVFDDQLAEMDKFKGSAERLFEVGSPSKWAGRLGESVSTGFDGTAVFTPQMGDFESMVNAQDMAVHPFLTDVPSLPDQSMAVTPYLTEIPPLMAQQQVQAATPPMMAAGASAPSVSNSQEYNLNYTGQQYSSASVAALMTMLEMRGQGRHG